MDKDELNFGSGILNPVQDEFDKYRLGVPEVELPQSKPDFVPGSVPGHIQKLLDWGQEINLCKFLPEDKLAEIGDKVCLEFELDNESRSVWLRENQEIASLARMDVGVDEGLSDEYQRSKIKYPEIARSAVQFGARAFTSIFGRDPFITGKAVGEDPEGVKLAIANRRAEYLEYILKKRQKGWIRQEKKRAPVTFLYGNSYSKTYFDYRRGHPVTELIMPEDLVYHKNTRDFEDCRRITHLYLNYRNDIIERMFSGEYRTIDLERDLGEGEDSPPLETGTSNDIFVDSMDSNKPYHILEQHRWLDLDGDGYEEPYVVMVHYETRQVLRIRSRWMDEESIIWDRQTGKLMRIDAWNYFDIFECLPSVDNTAYGIGIGQLLNHPTRAMSALLNIIIETGKLNASFGGMHDGMIDFQSSGGKIVEIAPNEWTEVHVQGPGRIQDHVLQYQFPSPSRDLFAAVEFMREYMRDLSGAADVLSGREPSANTPATSVMSLIEQGLQMFTSIVEGFHHTYESIFRKMDQLIRKNIDYLNIVEDGGRRLLPYADGMAAFPEDYDQDGMVDIALVSNPKVATNMQKLMRAEAILRVLPNNPVAIRLYLEALDVENIEEVLRAHPPDPKAEMEREKLELEKRKLELEGILAKKDIESSEIDNQKKAAEAMSAVERIRTERERVDMDRNNQEMQVRMNNLVRQNQELTALVEQFMGTQRAKG